MLKKHVSLVIFSFVIVLMLIIVLIVKIVDNKTDSIHLTEIDSTNVKSDKNVITLTNDNAIQSSIDYINDDSSGEQQIVYNNEDVLFSPDISTILIPSSSSITILNFNDTERQYVFKTTYADFINGQTTEYDYTDDELNNYKIIDNSIYDTKWINNNTIVFSANALVNQSNNISTIWSIDTYTSQLTKIIDGYADYELFNLLYANSDKVLVWAANSRQLITFTIVDGSFSYQPLKGVPFSVSTDGNLILFNSYDENSAFTTTVSDVSILNLQLNETTQIKHLSGYHIYKGIWRDDNNMFAFYSRHYSEVNQTIFILDLDTQTIYKQASPRYLENIDETINMTWYSDSIVKLHPKGHTVNIEIDTSNPIL